MSACSVVGVQSNTVSSTESVSQAAVGANENVFASTGARLNEASELQQLTLNFLATFYLTLVATLLNIDRLSVVTLHVHLYGPFT